MRCFVQPSDWLHEVAPLSAEESHHLLRAAAGSRVEIFNGQGGVGTAEVVAAKAGRATLRVLERKQRPRPATDLVLVQAVLREQKMDFIIQKATELGAAAVTPVLTENSVVRLKAAQAAEKKARREKIALNAAKQSGVAWLPAVGSPVWLADFLAARLSYDLFLVGALDEPARPVRDVLAEARARRPRSAAVLVGPEGDFSAAEMESLRAAGAVAVRFGESVLRAETPALYALSVLRYELL